MFWVCFSVLPSNLNVETMPLSYQYYGNINETINCTANMNPDTTVLYLIGTNIQLKDDYVFAERKFFQTIVDSENKIGCYPTVRTVFKEVYSFLAIYDRVGCLANDTMSGQSLITEFKNVNVLNNIN